MFTQEEKDLIKSLSKEFADYEEGQGLGERQIEILSYHCECNDLTDITIQHYESESEWLLTAIYYSGKIGYSIVLDWDVNHDFDNIDEFITYYEELIEKQKALEDVLPIFHKEKK